MNPLDKYYSTLFSFELSTNEKIKYMPIINHLRYSFQDI